MYTSLVLFLKTKLKYEIFENLKTIVNYLIVFTCDTILFDAGKYIKKVRKY